MATFAGAAHLSLRSDGEKGRTAVLSGALAVDDIVLEEPPLASLVLQAYEERVCARCFRPLSAAARRFCCGECGVVRYCSASCRDDAKGVHDAECDAFVASARAARSSGCDVDLLRIVARLLWTRAVGGDEARWEAAGGLLSHQYDLASTEEEASRWKESVVKGLTILRRKLPDRTEEFIEEGAKWASIVNTNAHGILSRGDTGFSIGLGLFPQIAILNHSCVPNAAYEFSGSSSPGDERVLMSVRAMCSMKEGDEATVSYCDLLQGTAVRRDRLQREKQFRCDCRRCRQDLLSEPEDVSPENGGSRLVEVRSDAEWLAQVLSGEAQPHDRQRGQEQDLVMRAFDHALCAICCPRCGVQGILIPYLRPDGWTCCVCEMTIGDEKVKTDVERLEEIAIRAEKAPEGDVMKIALILQALRICASAADASSPAVSAFADNEEDPSVRTAMNAQGLPKPGSLSLHPLHRLNLTLYIALVEECVMHESSERDATFRVALSRIRMVCEALLPEGSAERRRFASYPSS